MKKSLLSAKSKGTLGEQAGGPAPRPSVAAGGRKLKPVTREQLSQFYDEIQEKLDLGLSSAAQNQIEQIFSTYNLKIQDSATLHSFLSLALEMRGKYQDALEAVRPYEDDDLVEEIEDESAAIPVLVQLALCYSNIGDYPKAVAILKIVLEEAQGLALKQLYGKIHTALARVYRKLNEHSIARDYAAKGLTEYREAGDWRGMAQAYYTTATAYFYEGKSEEAVEGFKQVISIIGDRPAPFLLGIAYADLAGAYWLMRQPHKGIECLVKSIDYFKKTEHKSHAIGAYNNLGLNLMLIGDWKQAEETFKHSLDIATEINSPHIAVVMDSLGELKYLRGEFEAAQDYLDRAMIVATESKRDWYRIQILQNLARCYLAQEKIPAAVTMAQETVAFGEKIGEGQWASLANTILAETYIEAGELLKAESILQKLEEMDVSTDFAVSGEAQRARGLVALAQSKDDLAAHYFSRSLSIFETTGDVYRSARANYELGKAIAGTQTDKAVKSLSGAVEVFRKLGAQPLLTKAEAELEKIKTQQPVKKHTPSASTQLMVLRLAEAVASRELLFRELQAVMLQETKAKRVLIIQPNEEKELSVAVSHGYDLKAGTELANKFKEAKAHDKLEIFSQAENLAIFHLHSPNSFPAELLVYPRSATTVFDGSSIQPFLRIVELGMDICALREKDKTMLSDLDTSSMSAHALLPGFIHSSPAMTSLVEEIYKIRSSNVTVLVTGESGTGKELVSRAIHAASARKDKAFIPFNCTAVPKELAEGHLFGYKKGAFTGAVTDSPGVIRSASDGTLFLDEVGDLPLDVQPKLLRFLQEGEIQPLGERQPISIDVRIIAATNVPLEEKVEQGIFREDLYYRLNVIRLRVPPLRERRSEIPPMVSYYLNHYASKFGRRDITITPEAVDLLMVCEWEGNVRQLCNELQRLVARAADGEVITAAQLSPELNRSAMPMAAPGGGGPFGSNVTSISSFTSGLSGSFSVNTEGATMEEAVSELERNMIRESMSRHNGNISRVSRELGLTRRGLYLKLERYQLSKIA
jgi:DNA-binding NtrC family response regulator/tetratricopeptide (TPR) repeat protein